MLELKQQDYCKVFRVKEFMFLEGFLVSIGMFLNLGVTPKKNRGRALCYNLFVKNKKDFHFNPLRFTQYTKYLILDGMMGKNNLTLMPIMIYNLL